MINPSNMQVFTYNCKKKKKGNPIEKEWEGKIISLGFACAVLIYYLAKPRWNRYFRRVKSAYYIPARHVLTTSRPQNLLLAFRLELDPLF